MSLAWQLNPVVVINKHLMTGAEGKSEFCFPKTLNVDCFTQDLFCYTSQLKNRAKKTAKKSFALLWLADHVRVESYFFLKELASFIRPRALVSFDRRHVTRSPTIGKRFRVERYNKNISLTFS